MDREQLIRELRLKAELGNESLDTSEKSTPPLPVEDQAKRYEVHELLGDGAAGEVYKAFDTVLKRTVALKFLRNDTPWKSSRFLKEAQTQARMDHPGICRVYEVGEWEGKSYIAMQYVDGATLLQASTSMTTAEKVRVVKETAEAIHAAHKAGLIHRDLKPGNILVSRNETGLWTAYVTDFGLAHEMDGLSLTQTGAIVGTPHYMAPEQVRGEHSGLGPPTDVYSLGATLYELISGRPPFDSEGGMEVFVKVLKEDPVMLRQRTEGVDHDLEVIVMKCLEKDAAHRYQTARELAEDLARYLDGEPILARPASWRSRLVKKARKHKATTAVLAVALMLAVAFALLGLHARWNAQEQLELAQEFSREAEKIEGFLRYVYSLPIHDVRTERKIMNQRMEQIRLRMQQLGKSAEGPGYFALGRGFLALREYDRALEHLKHAWDGLYRNPKVASALGSTLGGLYQRELEAARRVGDKDQRKKMIQEAEKQFREPALQYLALSRSARAESPAYYVEGLIAFYEGKYDQALQRSAQALREAPWSYEAMKLQGDAFAASTYEKRIKGEYAEALEEFRKAEATYGKASEIARSDETIYEAQCGLWIDVQNILAQQGSPPEEGFEKATAACDRCLQVNPENAGAYVKKSRIYWQRASARMVYDEKSIPLFQEAARLAQIALTYDPELAEAHIGLGTALYHLATIENNQGRDPAPLLQSAGASFRKAIVIKPSDWAYSNLGLTFVLRADSEFNRGLDPHASLGQAIDAYEKAVAINPESSSAFNKVGTAYGNQADYELSAGKDPRPSLLKSIENYEKAIQLNPRLFYTYSNLGTDYTSMGKFEMKLGENPVPSMDRSIEYCRKAIEMNPEIAVPYENMAVAYRVMAEYSLEQKKDPSEFIDLARAAIREPIRLDGADHLTYLEMAAIEMAASEWAMQKGKNADRFLQEAWSALQSSLKMNSSEGATYRLLAKFSALSAEEKIRRGENPQQEIQTGLRMADRALSIQPDLADAYLTRADLYELLAGTRKGDHQSLDLSRQSREKAYQLDPYRKRTQRP